MLNILANSFNTATRTNHNEVPISQEERHKEYLRKKAQARRELEYRRDQAFYRKW